MLGKHLLSSEGASVFMNLVNKRGGIEDHFEVFSSSKFLPIREFGISRPR